MRRSQTLESLNDSIDAFLVWLWKYAYNFICDCGRAGLFFLQSIGLIWMRPYRWDELFKHMEFIGNKSLIIICLTAVFTGLALSYQIFLGFSMVNATNLVGSTVALGIAKELGPVLTGLIVAARAGGAMAARLGTMRVSEQIDALEVMGINPRQYLVAPRILAALITMPLLCGVFDFVAMLGSYFLCVRLLGLDEAVFWDKIQQWIIPADINEGLFKSAIFGLIFSSVCTAKGYYCRGGAKGVGEATNQGVVNSMVMIIIFNYFITNMIHLFYILTGRA
jgi:phospholipid/cholesterol/gamma-HCH transport system permease protein